MIDEKFNSKEWIKYFVVGFGATTLLCFAIRGIAQYFGLMEILHF